MKKICWAFVCLIWLVACDKEKPKTDETNNTPPPVISVKAPDFNADSAYAFVSTQVDFGPRVPNSKPHRECGDYLINTLKAYGAEVMVQEFVAD
jgi:glutaminyl-peptide cyclotransferase